MFWIDLHPEDEASYPGLLLEDDHRMIEAPLEMSVGPRVAFVAPAPPLTPNPEEPNNPFTRNTERLIQRMETVSNQNIYRTTMSKEPHSGRKKVPKKVVTKAYPGLLKELKLIKPSRILAIGPETAETLCPGFKNLREDHGGLLLESSARSFRGSYDALCFYQCKGI